MPDALARLWLDLRAVVSYAVADTTGLFVAWTVILGGMVVTAAFLFGWLMGSREARVRVHTTRLWKLVGELRARLARAEEDRNWLAEECERLSRERITVAVETVRDPHLLAEIERRRTG